ncbi:MAG TPA: glycerol-3-phosphate dehydrogenase/oxidase [Candidatus Limnocylindrales bacterium]|nr:glycerol-3-phosphate dehydrogenase/oxidase [Candidatus Limnocylindrales bacterium]
MTTPSERRAADLARLADERWDLLIVGGGIVGAGALLDAASRGMKVALVEQDDIAAGTSSRSSRLIHGGLRYLQQGQVGLVREALAERARLLRLAPHLVRLEAFLFPIYGPRALTRAVYEIGLTGYDLLGSRRSAGPHRHLGLAQTLEYAPNLRREGLRGALLYHDAMEDDARYTLAVVRTALAHAAGAAAAVTRVRARGPLHDGDRIAGASVEDVETGTTLDVSATAVLDATGVWGALPDRPFGGAAFDVLPARGSHLVIERDRIPARGGMSIRHAGHTVFLVPWPGHWLVGTTDEPYRGPLDHVAASPGEVDAILGTLNGAMDLGLSRLDIAGTYAGLRPLVAPSASSSTVKVSREHRVAVEAPGLVRVSGGKYTTYRVMARDAVDAVLGRGPASLRPSATAELPIHGAAPRAELVALAAALARDGALTHDQATSLVDRHGTDAPAVADLGREHDLLRPLAAGHPFLEAEIGWAVERELATTLDDLLARRLRLAPVLRDRGEAVAPRVAAIAGGLLGWAADRQAEEVARYLATARREFGVPSPD